jgi:GTPase Era involved in 16S rRNA processing
MPTKFFAGELIREKIFDLFDQEIPYQTTVMVQGFEEKNTLIKIKMKSTFSKILKMSEFMINEI